MTDHTEEMLAVCVAHMLKLKSESKSSVGSLLYNSAVRIVTF